MTVMKKTVCLLLAVVTSLSLFGCKNAESSKTSELLIFTETTAATSEATTEPESAEIAEVPVTENTVQFGEEPKPTEETDANPDDKTDTDPKTESDHTHQWNSSVVSSTCATQGYTLRTCRSCGKTTKDSFTASKEHSWGSWKTVVSATTTSTGKSERKCSICGKVESKTLDKLPVIHSHKYTGTVTTQATCTKMGVKTFVCACGSKYTEAIQKIPHSYKEAVVTPTCTVGGYTSHICSKCSDSYVDTKVPAAGHSWGAWKTTKEATESSVGTKERTCATCKDKETDTIPKLAHTHKYTTSVTQPTCTAEGYTTHKCTCGDTYVDSKVAATGHSWSTWKTTKEATESSVGTKERTCATCTAKETSTIPKLAHTHKYTATVAKPTCTTEGYTTHKCTCGDAYVDSKVAATGHSWSAWKTTKEATESSIGTKERTCTICKDKETGTIPKLAHTHKYSATVTKPTCTTEGYTTHTCSCGDSYVDSRTSAAGHSWNDWQITKEATTSSTGTKERTCISCRTVETATIPMLTHTHSYISVVTKPTCTKEGYTTYTCTCGESYADNNTSATGHNWESWITTCPPTASDEGCAVRACKTCGETESKTIDKLPSHEHSWSLVQSEYKIRQFAVCPHCDVYLCELDGTADPNDALWAHIEESGGDWYNHSWANDVEYILLKPAHWKCAECGEEKPFES